MKVTTPEEFTQQFLPKKITFSVTDPITHRDVYRVEMNRKEAEEAVEYLRAHNGSAPQFVHRFIDGMEIALSLRI
jgi:hypothetical protein